PRRTIFEAENVWIGVVHGHRVGSSQELEYTAAEMDADLLVYGHSHKPSFALRSVGLLNPGSPTNPRGYPPTYARLRFEDGRYEGSIIDLENNDELISIEGE
ncbi:MAG: YfcE family phosphodiesterase, partial [Halobacteria archaeon]|nr:YfcE family phosphodiesterase [Halobacteria archaeon]